MRQLVYLTAARRDLAGILRYVTEESGSLAIGQKFVAKLRAQCLKLASLPGTLGRARPELQQDVRSFAFRSYVILFKYDGDVLKILSILEGHQDIDANFGDDQ